MNKKGFTLVELLSVIVLIGLLLGIGVPGVMRISKKMKERSFNTKKEQIEQAATLWGQDNRTRLSKSTCKVLESGVEKEYHCYKISIKELIEEDYLDNENNNSENIEYKNPIDNQDIQRMCVYVYKKNKRVYAYYTNKEDTECKISS